MMTGGGGGGVAYGAFLLAVESGSGNGSRVSVSVRVDGIKYCMVKCWPLAAPALLLASH